MVPHACVHGFSFSAVSRSVTISPILARTKSATTALASRLVTASLNVPSRNQIPPRRQASSHSAVRSAADSSPADRIGDGIGMPRAVHLVRRRISC